MKNIITFSLPSSINNSVLVEEDILPHMFSYLHQHEEMQMTLILSGEGTLLVGNEPFDYGPSHIFLIKGNVPHVFKSKPSYFDTPLSRSTHAIHIYFNYDRIISHLKHLPEFTHIKAIMDGLDNGLLINMQKESGMIEEILAIKRKRGVDRFIKFVSLLNRICSRWDEHRPIAPYHLYVNTEVQDGAKWSKVYRYVLAHYTDDISLKDIAEVANLTPQAFCKYFKKRTRKTFGNFLNEMRIKEAINQMTGDTFLGISQTAYNTGFKSAVHFNRTFKKITGASPSGYLKNHYTMQQQFMHE